MMLQFRDSGQLAPRRCAVAAYCNAAYCNAKRQRMRRPTAHAAPSTRHARGGHVIVRPHGRTMADSDDRPTPPPCLSGCVHTDWRGGPCKTRLVRLAGDAGLWRYERQSYVAAVGAVSRCRPCRSRRRQHVATPRGKLGVARQSAAACCGLQRPAAAAIAAAAATSCSLSRCFWHSMTLCRQR